MDDVDKKKYLERYNRRLDQFGFDPKTLGWGHGREGQHCRFTHLLEIRKFIAGAEPASLLDVGCGFGDLGGFLEKQFPGIRYHGIDINPKLIEEGLKHYPHLSLQHGDLFEQDFPEGAFDLVVESGMFNFKLEEKSNHDHIREYLTRFYKLARLGVAADFMTTYVDFQAEGNFHLSPQEAYDIAKSITDKVVLRSDYMKYEYMIYLIKA